mmetsp:Transcript_120383/g.323154  ORF Transcript_120383/g.323154 Transcript_120383/m.323154 type:complete len:258 (+) Transcript_120383:364-1137(+)
MPILSSRNSCWVGGPGISVISLPYSPARWWYVHQAQSSLMPAVPSEARWWHIHSWTPANPSTVSARSTSLTNRRPSRVSPSGLGLLRAHESHGASSGPFVNESRIKTGPATSLYSVWMLCMRRSGTPGTDPSMGPMSSSRREKMGCLSSQNAFHSVCTLAWSLPKERKRMANFRCERCRAAARWKSAGKALYLFPSMPAAAAASLLTYSGGSSMRSCVVRRTSSISCLVSSSPASVNVISASFRAFLSTILFLTYCA